jgi:hypothetical protein
LAKQDKMHAKQDKMHMKQGESSLHNIPNDLSQRHEDRKGRKEVSAFLSAPNSLNKFDERHKRVGAL